ncbi:MAG: hypothetical protein V4492_01325 [Chlamydiota bacterium]
MSNPVNFNASSAVARLFDTSAATTATNTPAATGNSSASTLSSASKTEEKGFFSQVWDKVAAFASTIWNGIANCFRTVFCCKEGAATVDDKKVEDKAKEDAATAASIVAQFDKQAPNAAAVESMVAQFVKMSTPLEMLKVLHTVCSSDRSSDEIAKAFSSKMPECATRGELRNEIFVANGSLNALNGNVINGDFGAVVLEHNAREGIVQTALSNRLCAEIAKLPTPAAKMAAYADLINNPATSNLVAFNLYTVLPVEQQNAYKGEIYDVNGKRNRYNGADHADLGQFVVTTEPVSDLAKKAAVSYVAKLNAPATTPAAA